MECYSSDMGEVRECQWCHATISDITKACPKCFRPLTDTETGHQPLVVKSYRGQGQSIYTQYQRDLPIMEARGYTAESQQVIPGQRGGCLMLCGVLTLGLLFLFVRPQNTLMVTYRLKTGEAGTDSKV